MKHSRFTRRLTAVVVALAALTASAPLASADDATAGEPVGVVADLDPTATGAGAPMARSAQPDTTGVTANGAQAWDYFRLLNLARIDAGAEPAIRNAKLNTIATEWATAQAAAGSWSLDDSLEGKLPAGWTSGRQSIYSVVDETAEAAVAVAAERWADSHWGDAPVTDLGIGLVEKPLSGGLTTYTLYVIGATYPHSSAQTGETTLYRFYRPSSGTHFYSTTKRERNSVIGQAGFRYEGQVAYVLTASTTGPGIGALNRFYRPSSGTHFYTSSKSEYTRVLGYPQYKLNGVAGKVFTTAGTGRVPMYRFYRPASGTHFYTASASEVASVKKLPGYSYEGIAFYLRKAS